MPTADYKILHFADLSPDQQTFVPPLAERQALRIGDTARLYVQLADGQRIAPWVTIINKVAEGLCLGEVGPDHETEWLPRGFSVVFTPDNVIEL